MFYLIHQGGKVASQTLEATIARSDPTAKIERHHFLWHENLSVIDAVCDRSGPSVHTAQQRQQTNMARAAMEAFRKEHPRNVVVLSGFRDPLDHVISKFFQNLSEYCPSSSSPAAGEDYDRVRFDVEVDRVIEVFKNQVATYLEKRRAGSDARSLLETFWEVRYALHIEDWFEIEFKPLHRVDVYDVEFGSKPFVQFEAADRRFVFYRMETLRGALERLLEALPLPRPATIVNLNVATEKEYAVLYRRFRERFSPTPGMMAYYYGGRFFEHFYGDTRPLYSEGRRGLEIAV